MKKMKKIELKKIDQTIYTEVLDNGLTIYLYKDNRKHSAFFEIDTFCGGFTKDFIYHLHHTNVGFNRRVNIYRLRNAFRRF